MPYLLGLADYFDCVKGLEKLKAAAHLQGIFIRYGLVLSVVIQVGRFDEKIFHTRG